MLRNNGTIAGWTFTPALFDLRRELGNRLKLLQREFLRRIRRRIGRLGSDFLVVRRRLGFHNKFCRIADDDQRDAVVRHRERFHSTEANQR